MHADEELSWLGASYRFHTFAYRDPRAAFTVAAGLPVVSPTAVLLGIVSTLFSIGDAQGAQAFLSVAHKCQVCVDAPDAVVFFRAFHQLRRYETAKNDKNNPRLGMTLINQGVREHGLVQGAMTVWVAVPTSCLEPVRRALLYRPHIGTHDSLCSLEGQIHEGPPPPGVVYLPPEVWQRELPDGPDCTLLTLARFSPVPIQPACPYWHLAGGSDTELVPYLIRGSFRGTSRGKIYRKRLRQRQ